MQMGVYTAKSTNFCYKHSSTLSPPPPRECAWKREIGWSFLGESTKVRKNKLHLQDSQHNMSHVLFPEDTTLSATPKGSNNARLHRGKKIQLPSNSLKQIKFHHCENEWEPSDNSGINRSSAGTAT